jgi:hypothetical protein
MYNVEINSELIVFQKLIPYDLFAVFFSRVTFVGGLSRDIRTTK